jgi:hypothetical protein
MTLPAGIVTFFFSDIREGMELRQKHPDAIPILLARQNEILGPSSSIIAL